MRTGAVDTEQKEKENKIAHDIESEEQIRFQVRENRTALVCGVLAVVFAVFVLIMRITHPAAGGGGILLYLPLTGMLAGGAVCFMLYFNRKLTVDGMNICYVNIMRKEKHFTLDDIGYCKVGTRRSAYQMAIYDLNGKVLCKLDFEAFNMAGFYQYLIDNRVAIEQNDEHLNRKSPLMAMINAIGKETAVCEEEIRKTTDLFYGEAERIFAGWEKNNHQFGATWEFGFAEYTARDLETKKRLHEYTSSVSHPMNSLPESYECLLEAYLKYDGKYVVSKRGKEVVVILPCFSRTRSYQIGEKTRIRKTDEQLLKEWLMTQLESVSRELPGHRYHTEAFTIAHPLTKTAGIG